MTNGTRAHQFGAHLRLWLAKPAADTLFCRAGYNVCIFAYGQTGSGKTHTMSGSDVENLAGRGINYRALDDLFAINARRTGEVTDSHQCGTSCQTDELSTLLV